MELILTVERFSARESLDVSALSRVGFQLLPYVQHEPAKMDRLLSWQENCAAEWKGEPLLSLITWCSNPQELAGLKQIVASLRVQSSRAFELLVLVVGEGSLIGDTVVFLKSQNIRLRVFRIGRSDSEQGSFGRALMHVGSQAAGSYLQVVSPSSFLHPTAIFTIQKQLLSQLQGSDVVLLNELGITEDSLQPRCFWRKSLPDSFSLLCYNFWGEGYLFRKHIWTKIEEAVFEKIELAMWRAGAGHWVLALAIFRSRVNVGTLPLALLLRTRGPCIGEPISAEHKLVLQAVANEAVRERGLPFIEVAGDGSVYHPVIAGTSGEVQIVIPFRDQSEVTCRCLQSIARQTVASDVLITLVDNGSKSNDVDDVRAVAEALFGGRYQVIRADYYFNFARLNNDAVQACSSPYILFLNNDVELDAPDLIARLREWAALDDVGLVGARLLYPDRGVQSAGIVFPAIGPANIVSEGQFASVTREVSAVSFACAMLRRTVFDRVGALDELLCPNGFGDALFGLRVQEAGLKVILCAEVTAIHYESRTRSRLPEELERLELERAGLNIPVLHDDFSLDNHSFIVDYSHSGSTHLIGFARWLLGKTAFRKPLEGIIRVMLWAFRPMKRTQ